MTALVCVRCGREIVPGALVEFVGPDELSEVRIISSDEALVVHAECPPLLDEIEGDDCGHGRLDRIDGNLYRCRDCGTTFPIPIPPTPVEVERLSYGDACREAATDQGLDPIVARIDEAFGAGTAVVEQTGGFVMNVCVYGPNPSRYLGLTSADWTYGDGVDPGSVLVVEYDDREGHDEGTVLAEAASLDETVDLVVAFVRRASPPS